MSEFTRRQSLKAGLASLTALAAGNLLLRASARPTAESGEVGDYAAYLDKSPAPAKKQGQAKTGSPAADKQLSITEDNILGPFYRPAAPFRAKITPPLESGMLLVISGRVWSFASKKPISNAVIDIWQADSRGRYDNDDPQKPPAKGVFVNRARLISDENGYYEFESIHPGRYKIGPATWRPSHIHYLVQAPGHKTLVTQLYFAGDPHNETDQFIKKSLIVSMQKIQKNNSEYERGVFDIVLAPS